MNRFRAVHLLLAACAVSLVVGCGDSNGPPQPPPAAPDSLIAATSSTTEIGLAWTDKASNEDGFRIEQAPGGTTTFTEIGTVAAGVTGFQSTGLSAGTAYSYRVRAYSAAGLSGYSNTATATTQITPPALAATAVSTSQIDLSWTDNASNEDGFRIEQAPGGTTAFAEIGTVAAGITSFQSTGLLGGTSYSYRVRAYNAAGASAYSNTATATTNPQADVPPAAPTALVGATVATSRIDLSWTDNATNEDGFRIEQVPRDATDFTEIGTVAAGVTTFRSTGLNGGTSYSYRVRAYNAAGPSAYSNTASVATDGGATTFDGLWAIEPTLSMDCVAGRFTLDTVTIWMTVPGEMTFTLKGHLYPGNQPATVSAIVAFGGGNAFAGSGTKTESYGSISLVVNGQFTSNSTFTADVQATGEIRFLNSSITCHPKDITVIGARAMSLLPASLAIFGSGASGILTVGIPADQPTTADVALSIAPAIGIVPATVRVYPGENSATFTVTGTEPGTATVTATWNGLSATSTLVVSP